VKSFLKHSSKAKNLIRISKEHNREEEKKNHKVSFQVDSRSTGEEEEKNQPKNYSGVYLNQIFLSLLRWLVCGCLRHIFPWAWYRTPKKLNAQIEESKVCDKFFAARRMHDSR